MVLILVLAILACTALVPLVLPLLCRNPAPQERGHFDRVVYRDQLRELDRDLTRGVVTDTEATSARLEIQRRLLAADSPFSGSSVARAGRSPVLASFITLFAAGGAVAVYAVLGAPGIPDTPFSLRQAIAGETPANASRADASSGTAPSGTTPSGHAVDSGQHDLAQALDKLAVKLQADPSNVDGWLLYARTAGSIRRWDDAVDAYRRLIALGQTGPDIQSGYGETLTLQADGIVTPKAHDAFVAAIKADPKNDVARYYLGLAAGQAGDPELAIKEFQTLLAAIPEDSPMRGEIGKRIAEAANAAGLPVPQLAKGTPPAVQDPDEAAMQAAAALPPDKQKDMIAGMVAKLAARMQAEPNDIDGWLRLGRAYVVQGDRDTAGTAYEKAAALTPGDAGIRLQAVEDLLSGLKPNDTLPSPALTLLHQVEAIAPEEPEVLWYLGVAAARDAHPAEAKRYWTRLLTKLPAQGEDAKMVKVAMESLKGG
jgi:cytochrome c-type biogenesis protein CcmH